MTPYMSLLVNHFAALLKPFVNQENTDMDLWLAAVETLKKSFTVDDSGTSTLLLISSKLNKCSAL